MMFLCCSVDKGNEVSTCCLGSWSWSHCSFITQFWCCW